MRWPVSPQKSIRRRASVLKSVKAGENLPLTIVKALMYLFKASNPSFQVSTQLSSWKHQNLNVLEEPREQLTRLVVNSVSSRSTKTMTWRLAASRNGVSSSALSIKKAYVKSLWTKRSTLLSGTKKIKLKKRLSKASSELWLLSKHNSTLSDRISKINSINKLMLLNKSLHHPINPIDPRKMNPVCSLPVARARSLLKIIQLSYLEMMLLKRKPAWPLTIKVITTQRPISHPDAINYKISNVTRSKIIKRSPDGKIC